MKVAIGDVVRVHYHPATPKQSFAEGVVSRVDVPTLGGRAFVIDVLHEVLFDREQRVRPGYQNFVLYERGDAFPGKIEVLSDAGREPAPRHESADREIDRHPPAEAEPSEVDEARIAQSEPDSEPAPTDVPDEELQPAEPADDPFKVEVERRTAPSRASLIAALFRR